MRNSDVNKSFVVRNVVDSVRNRFPKMFIGEVVNIYSARVFCESPFPSSILKTTQILLFLGIYGYEWLLCLYRFFSLSVNKFELCVSVWMLLSLYRFSVCLQAVPTGLQKIRYRLPANLKILLSQFRSKFSRAFTRPPQRTFWVATGCRVNDFVKRKGNVRLACS
jgi:hypothetical protein